MLKVFYEFNRFSFISSCLCNRKIVGIISKNIKCYKTYTTTVTKHESNSNFAEILSEYFEISMKKTNALIDMNKYLNVVKVDLIKESLKHCTDFKINKDVIKENLWLIKFRPEIILKRFNLISKMYLTDINHGVPFLKLNTKTLSKLCFRIISEAPKIPYQNRLYYLSSKMEVDPFTMGQYISKRIFVYVIPFEDLQETLQILLDMGVTPDNILKDLWVFRYKPNNVKDRLEKLQNIGKQRLMPWMVKCPYNVLERSINITMLTKSLLGENKSVLNYLAERLNCDTGTVFEMSKKIPYILIVRVAKVKNTLDFLFSEGYTADDIIAVPRVLAHSVNTMKKRLGELRSIGTNPRNLNVLCKSKRDFQKYKQTLLSKDIEIDQQTYIKEKSNFTSSDSK